PTRTWPARCTRTRASTRSTACRRWFAPSTTRCCAPTRSTMPRALTGSTGWGRSSPTWGRGAGGPPNGSRSPKASSRGGERAGAAGVHLEDQLASEKKCGHMGGKVLLPTSWAIRNLVAARLAADVSGVPTLIIARTDADAADMLISDADERDHEFITGERTSE